MDKINKSVNTLIKRKGMIQKLNFSGVNRISKEAEKLLLSYLDSQISQLFSGIKEEMEVQGKRIFDKEVFSKVLNNLNEKKQMDY